MIYIKIHDMIYPAAVEGSLFDRSWDNRETKTITMSSDYETVKSLFYNDVAWSILYEDSVPVMDDNGDIVLDENGQQIFELQQIEYDNSDFCLLGDIVVRNDGTISVKMGKKTELEIMSDSYAILMGDMA